MKKFFLVAALLLVSVFAFAQKPVRFGVYLGEATPFGDMGNGEIKKTIEPPLGDLTTWALTDINGKDGFADYGFNVGFDVTFTLPVDGLGVFGGIDFFFNSNQSALDDCLADYSRYDISHSSVISDVKYTTPYFMNIPILFGVNYVHNFNRIVGVWGEAGIGPNFRLISGYEMKREFNTPVNILFPNGEIVTTIEETKGIEYKSAVTLGFKIGAGVMLWNRMSIGLDFYSLGSAIIEGTGIYELGGEDYANWYYADKNFKGNNAISASELVVRVGYHF